MAAQTAPRIGPMSGMHTAGIYSDMTVDGPIIGTLVIIVDRAKNLPNRKTMGKQDPYCAARLGKEAKKTDTDRRGGQTPRWDQELRFTVHESPDYYNLKVSVFNDDKKTDLIGETWIKLDDVVVPGGGRNDKWHSLNYRGKYAGEIRMEMSYYDSRQPEQPVPASTQKRTSQVKRRPLPTDPASIVPAVTPDFGPRAYGRPRGLSTTPEANSPLNDRQRHSVSGYSQPSTVQEHYQEDREYQDSGNDMMQPDFLPVLPPKGANRSSLPPPRHVTDQYAPSHSSRQMGPGPLLHSRSAPNVHDGYPDGPDDYYGEEDLHPGMVASGHPYQEHTQWQESFDQDFNSQWQGPDEFEAVELPPLPPSHRNTPQLQRLSQVSSISPLQGIERGYGQSPHTPVTSARRGSADDYASRTDRAAYDSSASPQRRELPAPTTSQYTNRQSFPNTPQSRSPGPSAGSSPVYSRSSPRTLPPMTRHSVSDPYATSLPRSHPLANEVRRSVSPQPYRGNPGCPEPRDYHFPEDVPLVRPRAVSPQPSRSPMSIQHPVSSFSASQNGTSSDPRPSRLSNRATPIRKSVSPRPSPTTEGTSSSMPFSPDSFDAYNPTARSNASALSSASNPHSPYHIPSPPKTGSSTSLVPSHDPSKPIVGWDGREIDPSDHLPVDSWAPEPEQKNPVKSYAGNAHGFGPRTTPTGSGSSTPRKGNLIVNVRTKARGSSDDAASVAGSEMSGSSGMRNRLVKKQDPMTGGGRSPVYMPEPHALPLREIEVPNPYAGRGRSENFSGGGWPGHNGYAGQHPQAYAGHVRSQSQGYAPSSYGGYEQYGEYDDGRHGYGGAAPPPKPPKIPMQDGYDGVGASALSREMARIDIGGSRSRGSSPMNGGGSSAPARRTNVRY